MIPYIALLRGINVGGHNKVPMQALRDVLAGSGLHNVRTYIQSGNIAFDSAETEVNSLATAIASAIKERFGFRPAVLVMSREAFAHAAQANPFKTAEAEPKTLHLYFMAAPPAQPDLAALDALRSGGERFELLENVFYLHAPQGIGRSRLAERAERLLGEPATARNWRTVSKLLALAGDP